MRVIGAIARGFGLALGSYRLLLLLWLPTLLLALPAGLTMTASIHQAIGPSRVHATLERELDVGWYEEFAHRASGVERELQPSRLGGAAALDSLEARFSGDLFTVSPLLVGLGALSVLVWVLFTGGVVDRMARRHPTFVTRRFLRAGSEHFWRFLRLAVMAGVLYFLVYRLARRLFPWIEQWTRDVTVERTVLAGNLLGAAAVLALLALIGAVFDYAKIATVVEDRRSMLLAALGGARFVAAHPVRTFSLYAILAGLGALVAFGYLRAFPEGGSPMVNLALAFLVGQIYLVARIVLRLALLGGQLELFLALRGGGLHRRSW